MRKNYDEGIVRNNPEAFALCPLDGRYSKIRDMCSPYFSEYALVQYRVYVEIEWLKY